MKNIINMIIPSELNPEEIQRKKDFRRESEKISQEACDAKNRFEQSLLELEELLKEKKQRVNNNVVTK